jgi:hypothetical protein
MANERVFGAMAELPCSRPEGRPAARVQRAVRVAAAAEWLATGRKTVKDLGGLFKSTGGIR